MLRFSGKLLAAITAIAVVAMVSQAAVAQNEGGRRGRGGRGGSGGFGGITMARLLSVDKVQDALKLTEDQESKIKTINDDARKEMREEYQNGGRDREKIRKIMANSEEKVNSVLNEGQRKRLTGIYIQVAGAGAIMNPAVAKELDITKEQKTKIRDAMAEMRPAKGQGQSQDRASFRERREKMDKALMDILTPDQKQKLESLKGEKVDINMSDLRGPGGERARRGRANRENSNSK